MTGLALFIIGICGLILAILGVVFMTLKAVFSLITFRLISFIGSILMVVICAVSIPFLVLLIIGGGTLGILGI